MRVNANLQKLKTHKSYLEEFLVSINYVPAVGRLNVNQNIAADGSLPHLLTMK